jgi:hypothetical protein
MNGFGQRSFHLTSAFTDVKTHTQGAASLFSEMLPAFLLGADPSNLAGTQRIGAPPIIFQQVGPTFAAKEGVFYMSCLAKRTFNHGESPWAG